MITHQDVLTKPLWVYAKHFGPIQTKNNQGIYLKYYQNRNVAMCNIQIPVAANF